MRLRLWGSQALGHSDATGCFRRAENGIWAHWLDLVWGQGKRGNLASPVGRILGLMVQAWAWWWSWLVAQRGLLMRVQTAAI